jgi:hypothetical protein
MVAIPSDMREAAFLQLKAAYRKLCAAHVKVQQKWDEREFEAGITKSWLCDYGQLQSELHLAHLDFNAATRLFSRELRTCQACGVLHRCFHAKPLVTIRHSC